MTKRELINYWIKSSDTNYRSMINMFKIGEYMWSLFLGHLVIEKLLKALYVKNIDNSPPFIHDLYKLAVRSNLGLQKSQMEDLQYITLFNIETRYEDYKKGFYKKCTKEFARINIKRIEDLRKCIKKEIKK